MNSVFRVVKAKERTENQHVGSSFQFRQAYEAVPSSLLLVCPALAYSRSRSPMLTLLGRLPCLKDESSSGPGSSTRSYAQ